MQVLVIGATGFLGYHTTLKLLARGHQVSALARPPLPAKNLLPAEVKITLTDLEALPDSELLAYLQGQDSLLFAAGVDDRVTPARYPVCAENLTWQDILQRLGKILGKTKPIITLPKALVKLGALCVSLMHRLQGRESGLDLVPFVELQTRLAFLDPDYSARALGYAHLDLEPDFVKTVQASLPAGRN
jgi:Nucleoside-diphosphate-sugar epimerases